MGSEIRKMSQDMKALKDKTKLVLDGGKQLQSVGRDVNRVVTCTKQQEG